MSVLAEGVFVPAYAASTRSQDFAEWCEEFLVQSVDQFDGRPLVLEPWQLRFFSEALAGDDADMPYWRLVVLVVSRKNGKTLMLSAYSLYHLLEDEGAPEILLAASSDKQAGRLFDASVAFVYRDEELSTRLHLRESIGEVARVDGQGKVIRMASDPNRAHGYNPSLVVADELHAWTTPSLRKAWGAFISAGGARKARQVFAITTAGSAHQREDSILGSLIDGNEARGETETEPGLTVSRNHKARVLVYNYSAPTLKRDDVAALKLANPASWISEEYLREQAESPAMSDGEVLQLHGCVWAEDAQAWIPIWKWEKCELQAALPADAAVYVGVDAALTRDTSAVAWAWKADDRIHVRTRVWSARDDTAHHVLHRERIDNDELEDYILAGISDHVREVVYDPRYFETQAQHLAAAGLVVAPMEPWQAPARESINSFYRLVDEGVIAHDGDRVLTAHLRAVEGKHTDKGWRIGKADRSARPRPIDAVTAAAMAVARAEISGGTVMSVYNERELLII